MPVDDNGISGPAARFETGVTDGAARRGLLRTAHGDIETPAFMPVGTLGAVKGLGPAQLEDAGAQVMLANLYHLTLRPGIERIVQLGGLHRFCGWSRPILTDSGGYQVFSLSGLRKIDADGVTFRSPLDGSVQRFTPESVYGAQVALGVDVAMMLDECPPWPVDREQASAALERTTVWARRAREEQLRSPSDDTLLFGIAQGSFYPELRERAVSDLVELEFDGYAIGGVSVGEGPERGRPIVEYTARRLPADRPRYLMGMGTPADLVHAVTSGVDLFDCVLPSRNARHGFLYTRQGVVRILNSAYRLDPEPLDPECGCATCQSVSRAFLHHLFKSREITGRVLATAHNVRFYLDFMRDLREAVAFGNLARMAAAAELYGEPAEAHRHALTQ